MTTNQQSMNFNSLKESSPQKGWGLHNELLFTRVQPIPKVNFLDIQKSKPQQTLQPISSHYLIRTTDFLRNTFKYKDCKNLCPRTAAREEKWQF